jgi:hypothetical protein
MIAIHAPALIAITVFAFTVSLFRTVGLGIRVCLAVIRCGSHPTPTNHVDDPACSLPQKSIRRTAARSFLREKHGANVAFYEKSMAQNSTSHHAPLLLLCSPLIY